MLTGHRYYSPTARRFVTCDPIGYGGINLYAFCGNNPVMGRNPEGMDDLSSGNPMAALDALDVDMLVDRAKQFLAKQARHLSDAYNNLATTVGKYEIRDMATTAWVNGTIKKFPNLYPNDSIQEVNPSTLEEKDGKWFEVRANGEIRTAKGQYIFVRNNGKLYGCPARYTTKGNDAIGHSDISKGEPVDYAGQMRFNKKGILQSWDNTSGHYRPDKYYADQAGLPLDKFIPIK